MKLSQSVSHGQPGDRRHDLVAEYRMGLENVDATRTRLNVELVDVGLEETYQLLFSDSLENYNQKLIDQGRRNRVIDDYLLHITNSKQEKPEYEMVVQLGNRDTFPATHESCRKLGEDVYRDFLGEFQKRFSHFAITEAVIHNDESTPHLHVKYVPWVDGQKRGLSTRNSLSGAIKAMGFSKSSELNEELKEILSRVAKKHGVDRLDMGNHERHLSVQKFKAKMANIDEYRYVNDPDLIAAIDQQREIIERQSEMLDVAIAALDRAATGDLNQSRAQEIVSQFRDFTDRLRGSITGLREAVSSIPERWRDHIINPVAEWMKKPFTPPTPDYFPELSRFARRDNPYAPPWTEWTYEDSARNYIEIHVTADDGVYRAEATLDRIRQVATGETAEQAALAAHALLETDAKAAGIEIGNANVLKKTSPSSDPTSKPATARSLSVSADKARFQGNMPAHKPGRARKR